ncbi:substrate-binding periplasmic protein [Aquipseudomonas guryensis]|jgi:polar amino acid transport system substrate-binding protein|uniref:Transporter substrate-binding domain-containing protein n=1 Tax=Aquipseudomonas guryensis TaxID=2759165 RepID=A0A7W4H2Q5_9GAMM|nr:transporter substrate-binding domain-containing protein [Pseudomonas guryensis]MBB1518813.1 transporter substrate-binding domain-containing protein [Pseudomonas guryensis]
MPLFQRHLIATLLLSGLAFGAQAEPLRVVTEAWAPYVYEDNGKPAGLDYEITAEVLRRLDIEVQWQFLPWKRCLLALEQGQADAILDIFRLAEREQQMLFVEEPLSEVQFVLFFSRNRPYPYRQLEDLRDLLIGTSPGYWYNDSAFRRSKLFSREEAPSHEANLGKLVRNRVDLVVNDRRAGLFLAAQLGLGQQLGYNTQELGRDRLYLALRRDPALQTLAADFARELRRFKHEAAYAKLQRRYAEPTHAPFAAVQRP